MTFQNKLTILPIDSIIVHRDMRQRSEPEGIEELADSIARVGLIHPIIITKDKVLVAGERRLMACKLLGLTEIPTRVNTSLDAQELEIIELEENVRRSDLTWQDHVKAIQRLHAAYLATEPDWSQEKTAEALGYSRRTVGDALDIADAVDAGVVAVASADKMSEARTAVKRHKGRAHENLVRAAMEDAEVEPEPAATSKILAPGISAECTDFIEWSKTPRSAKFNFLHCDFPYGVNLQDSGQVAGNLARYDDTPEVYFALLEALTTNWNNFMLPSAHIMFWYSMKFYRETITALERLPEARIVPFPLIWHKSDGKGIVPDALREPRRTYETALMISLGDRLIRKPVANSFAAPTDSQRLHASRKPPAVLTHFFQLFCDSDTSLLDPTCGSGGALTVARDLKIKALGLEYDPEIFADLIL